MTASLDALFGPLFDSARIVDLILGLMAIEAAAVLAWRRLGGRSPRADVLLANLLAGGFLLLALRFSLSEAGWPWIAVALIAAFAAHLADLRGRWRAAPE